jgi:tripartite ATP-independent transporter DctM subunit
MSPEILAIVMFLTTLLFLLFGFPVAFTLAGSSLIFAFIGDILGVFNFKMLLFFPQRIYGVMINEALVAVPLFIFMGVMLEKTKIAAKLLESIGDIFGSVRGGLGIGVVLVGMLLAASTGIVGATVVTMGMLALPTMLKAGYDEKIATGTICASGTLGQIIPPSIVLILLAEMLQGANEEAGLLRGDLAPLPVTAIDLFAGALLPGLMLVGFFIIYILFLARIRPQDLPVKKIDKPRSEIWKTAFFEVLPPIFLILADSVGVAIPKKIEPSTASIKNIGGKTSKKAVFQISDLGLSIFFTGKS